MANKFPLILNTSANQIQEIASGDNLDLTGCGINNAGVITATSFSGNITGGVTGNADTATLATNVTVSANNSTNETVYPIFVDGATGTQGAESDTGLSYNPSTGLLTLVGLDISGDVDVDGTLEADAITVNGTALSSYIAGVTVTNATNSAHVYVTDNESTNESNLITFVENGTSSTGNVGLEMDGNLYYNPSSGTLTATTLQGTLATAAQTSITSVGTLAGLTVNGGDGLKVGSALTFSSTSGIATFSGQVRFNDSASGAGGSPKLSFGYSDDLNIYHTGDDSIIKDSGTGGLYLLTSQFLVRNAAGNETCIQAVENGDVTLYSDNSARFATTGAGSTSVGISTVQDFSSVGMLKERVEIVANKVSAVTNINIEDGNIHYFTTNETGTATPNIRYSSNKQLNNAMLIGETISVTIIFKPNGAGYYAQLTIDGSAVTEEWNGGSAPGSASAGGYDVYTYSITKTADASFLVLANFSNFA